MKKSQTTKLKRSIKEGQIWQLGEHKLLCSSSLDTELVNKLLAGEKISAQICDPPYGVRVVESKHGFAKIKVDKKIIGDDITSETDYTQFTKQWLKLTLPHLAKKNSIYIFNSDKMLFALKQALDELGIYFSQLLIWVKNHAVIGRKDYLPQHELIVFGWYGTHAFRRSKDKSVLFYPKPNKSELHPTMKPVGLIRNLILNSTNIGDIIWDGFLGSGTTLIAAEQTRRKCYGIEIDPEYCQTIINRWSHITKQSAQLIYEKN
ncbi:MAG: site-specific DNA-methyltransferase [Patescibacteria group bacterium]|nr:site-specific DNA-methyltransferase [Patescibacteria group bacterium]MDD4610468.1 site-specific DNA-methyltransferase [Patescibacteria group bacterium]